MRDSSEQALWYGFGLIVLVGLLIFAGVWWRHTHPTAGMLAERQIAQAEQQASPAQGVKP